MPRNSFAGKGEIKRSATSFRDMLKDGRDTPSSLLLTAMRGELTMPDGEDPLTMRERLGIGEKLVQYELPRLAAIEADIQTTEKTHEEWVTELGADLGSERVLQ